MGKKICFLFTIDISKDLPSSPKDLSMFAFQKQMRRYVLSTQEVILF